ncbi:DUF1631 family protein, partial [Pseudomonas syringae group genomosp. 7]|uniref:DUF1631 family protein n=1 Tax=Pseudomonas syringae group genomosp. 7 TaxID=251699 RepID=UPI00376F5991
EDANPLGPAMLCRDFLEAGRSLGVEIKGKLIILKLFEKYVLANTDHLYSEANHLLIATGVLPDMKALPTRRSSDRAARRNRGSEMSDPAVNEAADKV